MNAVGLCVPRQEWRLQGFVVVLLVLGFFLHAVVLPATADAAPYITRGEIMSRAFSALDTTYSQAGTHPKSWKPSEEYSEPQVDCSGLVQKSWQVPEQIYYGRWNEERPRPPRTMRLTCRGMVPTGARPASLLF